MSAAPEATGWRALAWRAYEHLPRSADGVLRTGTRLLLPFVNRHVPLAILRGPTRAGGDGAVLVAGAAPPYLPHRFFAAEPRREELGRVPVWRLDAALARRRDDVDLVIARLDRTSARGVLRDAYTAVPEWLSALAPVLADPWAYCRSRKSFHTNVARVRRAGFVSELSHAPADFEEFYAHMYAPFITARYGRDGVVSQRPRLRRCFNQGGVLFARRDGRRVAGALVRTRGRTLDLVVVGTAGGSLEPLRDGAAFALDLYVFEHARALGCTVIDLGGSRPSPRDGLLLYKARWNSTIVAGRTMFYDLHLAWRRLTPALLAFLAHTPLIIRQADGLAALCAPADGADTAGELGAMHAVLERVRRVYVLTRDAPPIADARLTVPIVHVDPTAQPDWRPPWHERC